ncbi:MAG: hypothetical protein IJS14_05850 [Lentisphaeria bacterium]|nr:hypothetical protein [Lentisphaeria bacterium]
MKFRWLFVLLLSAGCLLPLTGDEFDDLIQEAARVARNYNRAVNAPGTRFDKEFQTYLENLKRLSVPVQQTIRKLDLGQDFNFPMLSHELERIYQESQRGGKIPAGAKLDAHSISPEGLLKLLAADVNALRKMEFHTEDGGSIKSSLETRRKLMEFRRLVDSFRKNYGALRNGRQRDDVSMQRFLNLRLQRMSILAALLMQTARQKYPDSQSRYNIETEVAQLQKCFQEWRDLPANKPRKNGKPQHRKRTLSENATPAALRAEIDLSLRNINEQLIQWERSGFQSDGPIMKSPGSVPGKQDPADVLRQPTRTAEYGSLDQKSLTDLLNKRRQAVIRSNSSMDGFDHDAERMFLLSLSRDQKKAYNTWLRDFQQQGYPSGQAVRNAVLKTQTWIITEKQMLPVQDLIRILQAMDKEEARRLEKNNIQFRMERGGEREMN